MNRMQTIIFFIVLFIIDAIIYIFIYHKKKKKIAAIVVTAIISAFLLLSIISVLPSEKKAEITEIKVSNMKIEKIGADYYAVCHDKTKYKIKAMNTEMSSDYYSYRNDKKYKNEKVDITYRYNYKIWGFIPAHSFSHETDIYFNEKTFEDLYGCTLEYNTANMK